MKYTNVLSVFFLIVPFFSYSQETRSKIYTLEEVFDLVIQNNQALKISELGFNIAKQETDLVKLERLPSASLTVTGGYLGNVALIEKDLSKTVTVHMPHYGNTFSMQASQTIFNGNLVNNSIRQSSLREQVAYLNLERNKVDAKLLVAGNYLDLYKLYNQKRIYASNISLAKLRLTNIRKLYDRGVVTRNDIIRSELQIADLELTVSSLINDIHILNKRLTVATGLPERVMILPDTSLLTRQLSTSSLAQYQSIAAEEDPGVRMADISEDIANKNLAIAQAGRFPSLSIYAGNDLQRPVTSSSPALDKYSNAWQVGFMLSYNLASLYRIPEKVNLGRLQIKQAEEEATLIRQSKEVEVNAAYLRFQESLMQVRTLQKNVQLADENYRIIEKKYMNQLALLIDMLDASSTKLEAELRHTNATITALFTYYQLMAEIGTL